jgi:hypothetical protein
MSHPDPPAAHPKIPFEIYKPGCRLRMAEQWLFLDRAVLCGLFDHL